MFSNKKENVKYVWDYRTNTYNNYVSFVFFFLVYFLLIENIETKLPYKFLNVKTYNGHYVIDLCFGEPPNCYPLQLSTSINEILLLSGEYYEGSFEPSQSKTYKESFGLKKEYNKLYLVGKYCHDTVSLKDTQIILPNFRFILINSAQPFPYIGVLGIGNDYTGYGMDTNFIGSMIKQGYLDHPVYTFGKKNFILGDDIELNSEMKFYKTCNLTNDQERWGLSRCNVNSVIYNGQNNYFIDNEKHSVRFDIDFNEIYCPSSFFKVLEKDIFGKYISEEWCISEDNNKYYHRRTIKCYKEVFDKMKNDTIYFFIDKWSIKVKLGDLFENESLQIVQENWNQDWILGHVIMDKNSVTIDKQNNILYYNP